MRVHQEIVVDAGKVVHILWMSISVVRLSRISSVKRESSSSGGGSTVSNLSRNLALSADSV